MATKKVKSPLLVRKPEEINKEYSDLVIKVGTLELESKNLVIQTDNSAKRMNQIGIEIEKLHERYVELSAEMTASTQHQAEIQKKLSEDAPKIPQTETTQQAAQ